MPPPQKQKAQAPPPRRAKAGPPVKKAAVELPSTARVKVISTEQGFSIVTAFMGCIVGSRLDKHKATWYPECQTSGIATLAEARKSLTEWDKFMELQEEPKRKKK